jgi:radical SAM protein with 4Fe4S-binding SPASM domain
MRTSPNYIQFYPTLRCNKACGFCFNKNMPPMPDMPLAQFRKMLGTLKTAGVKTIDIIGGEPTLHQDLVSIIHESERNGFSVNLSSNGTDPEMLAEILASTKNTTVGVSVNDRATFEGLKEFIRKHRPVVKTIFARELDHGMVKDILDLRPKKFYLLYRDAMSSGEMESIVSFDLFHKAVTKKFDPSTTGMVYCSGFLPDIESCPELARVRCPAGTTKLGVMPDGSVYPCNLFFGIERLRLGNIFVEPFGKIWHHPALTFFRTFTKNTCPRTSCELHAQCHGGCPAHSFIHHNDLSGPDPRCVKG